MISDVPRQKLCEIVARYSQSVCDDPRKCEGLLRDFCGGYRREIHALVNALRERIAEDLLAASEGVPRELLVARLARRLEDNRGQDSELARWAVESWGLALGRLSPADLQKEPAKKPKAIPDSKPARVPDPTPIPQQQGPIRQAKPVPIVQPSPIPEPTPLPHPGPTPEPLPRRNYKLIAGALVALTLVGGGSKILWDKWRVAEEARRQAIIQAEAARRKAEEERKQVELRLQQERRQAESRLQQQERERQVLWQQQRQRERELQQQRALWEKQQRQRDWQQRPPQTWEKQQRQRDWQERQRQAQIEQQRRQQEWQERQRLEQERRQKEAQERAAQQQRDRLIQEGLRALERLGR